MWYNQGECMIPMPISDIVDRLSIAMLKQERTDTDMTEEINLYKEELKNYPDIDTYLQRLLIANGLVWDAEADLRKNKEDSMSDKEIVQCILRGRDANKIRVGIKNEIVEKYKEGFKDIKINHLSGA